MNPEAEQTDASPRQNYYPDTLWTQILRARGDPAESEDAWKILVERYRRPIEFQIEKHCHADRDPGNLVAEFIGKVFVQKLIPVADREKGRFRSLLATALHRFIDSELRQRYTVKHGQMAPHIPLDDSNFDRSLALATDDAKKFGIELDRTLAREAFHRAFEATRRQALAHGNAEGFDLLMGKPDGQPAPDQEIAERLRITIPVIKTRRHRWRTFLRETFRREVADLVPPEAVDEETQYLISLLCADSFVFPKDS